MSIGLFFPTSCVFFSILLNIIYFSKERLDNIENRLYKFLLIINLVTLMMEFVCAFALYQFQPIISPILIKIYLEIHLAWVTAFAVYMLYTSRGKHTIKVKYWIISGIIFSTLVAILPLEYSMTEYGPTATGPASDLVYVLGFGFVAIWAISLLFSKNKSIMAKKIVPIGIYVVLGIVVAIVQKISPGLRLVTSVETLVTFIMYFTIENPDLQLIEELNIAKEAADRANNAKTEFLSSMSHEIRTPLNAIVGFSMVLKDDPTINSQAKTDLKYISMASESLLEIVNGILDISKIEANKLEIVNIEYEPTKVYEELVALAKARLGTDKPIEFISNFDSNIPTFLYGDYARVKQVSLNILTNAIKYTEKGKIIYDVKCKIKDDVCTLIISVEDTGMGIKEENMDKLFTKFERLDEEKNSTIEGTGLGLAITKKLVELMNGTITVKSIYGKGSKFTITLDQKVIKKEKVEEKEVVINIDAYKNKRVLVVDDNMLNLKVAERMFKLYGIITDVVDSGAKCIEKVEMGIPYKIIFMDDMMPEMSGKETLTKLKENPEFKTPVIAVTANAIEGMKEEYLAYGFDDYLPKPLDRIGMDRVLQKYLGEEE